MIHSCADCGMLHDAPALREDSAVAIARIEAEARVAVAKLQARADSHAVEVEAESAVDVAQAQAEVVATVLAADPEPVVVEEAPADPPVVINSPIVDSGDEIVDETAPPARDESEHDDDESAPKRSRGLGMWG